MADGFLRACQNGDIETVKRLVESSDSNWRNPAQNTALMLACATGQDAIACMLLERQRQIAVTAVNAVGDTALLFGCVNGKPSLVRLLLDQKGVELDAMNG